MASLYDDLEDASVPADVPEQNVIEENERFAPETHEEESHEDVDENRIVNGAESVENAENSEKNEEKIEEIVPIGVRKPPRVFVGGLAQETTEEGLKMYFEKFGTVDAVEMLHDKLSGRHKGWAFVHYQTMEGFSGCLEHGSRHSFDGKDVEVKEDNAPQKPTSHAMRQIGGGDVTVRASPAAESQQKGAIDPSTAESQQLSDFLQDQPKDAPGKNVGRKVFIGGLHQDFTDAELKTMMEVYGKVEDAVVMMDRATGRSRGFGFVTYAAQADAEAASKVKSQVLGGKQCEVKLYQPGVKGDYAMSRGGVGGGFVAPYRPPMGGPRFGMARGGADWNRHRPFAPGGARGPRPAFGGMRQQQPTYYAQPQQQQQYYGGGGGSTNSYHQQSSSGSGYNNNNHSQQQQQQHWGGGNQHHQQQQHTAAAAYTPNATANAWAGYNTSASAQQSSSADVPYDPASVPHSGGYDQYQYSANNSQAGGGYYAQQDSYNAAPRGARQGGYGGGGRSY